MIEAAEAACNFVSGRTRTDLGSDQMLAFALMRAIEIELPELLPQLRRLVRVDGS